MEAKSNQSPVPIAPSVVAVLPPLSQRSDQRHSCPCSFCDMTQGRCPSNGKAAYEMCWQELGTSQVLGWELSAIAGGRGLRGDSTARKREGISCSCSSRHLEPSPSPKSLPPWNLSLALSAQEEAQGAVAQMHLSRPRKERQRWSAAPRLPPLGKGWGLVPETGKAPTLLTLGGHLWPRPQAWPLEAQHGATYFLNLR